MVKGLSKLQKIILKMAYLNQDRGYECGHVKNSDVLIGVYRFPAHSPSTDSTSGSPKLFNRQEIGISHYRSASVSVVKAFNRLIKRGLATRKYHHGIILTAEGAELAKTLMK